MINGWRAFQRPLSSPLTTNPFGSWSNEWQSWAAF